LEIVSGELEYALCKDEYIHHCCASSDPVKPLYRLGALKVIVGSNHLTNEVALKSTSWLADEIYKERVERGAKLFPQNAKTIHRGRRGELEWYWYHFGSGHHFTNSTKPNDWEHFLRAANGRISIVDLLEARSGVYHPTVYETKGMEEQKPPRGSHLPGTFWYYNNWDFNALGFIYEKATGEKIFDAFYWQIAQPIGMQAFKSRDGRYITSSDARFPAYPFDMSARDFARFALLYLREGKWNGTQVVPEEWVKISTRP
jgi:hypothetical protein